MSFALAAFFLIPFMTHAQESTIDLGIRQEDIVMIPSPSQLVAGQKARIYATVHNFGDKDAKGIVSFYQGPYLIGESQPISVRARGFADEVFIDFVVPSGSFNILAKLQSVHLSVPPGQSTPQIGSLDQNPSNDEAVTPLITPLPDVDADGGV